MSQVDENQCNMNCSGNALQKCGSIGRNSVYCLNPPCETTKQHRFIGSNYTWTPMKKNFTFDLSTNGQNKLSQIVMNCSVSRTVGLQVVYSDGQSIQTYFNNDVASLSPLTAVKVNFTNKKFAYY